MLNTHYFTSNAHDGLFNRIKLEAENNGYYNLPQQNLDYLSNYLEKLDDKHKLESITDVVVVGIGGSSLGAKAIYNFLEPLNDLTRHLHFLDSTDPIAIRNCCQKLNLNTSHFLIISNDRFFVFSAFACKRNAILTIPGHLFLIFLRFCSWCDHL